MRHPSVFMRNYLGMVIILAISLVATTTHAQPNVAQWLGGVGSWDDPNQWTSFPFFPTAGQGGIPDWIALIPGGIVGSATPIQILELQNSGSLTIDSSPMDVFGPAGVFNNSFGVITLNNGQIVTPQLINNGGIEVLGFVPVQVSTELLGNAGDVVVGTNSQLNLIGINGLVVDGGGQFNVADGGMVLIGTNNGNLSISNQLVNLGVGSDLIVERPSGSVLGSIDLSNVTVNGGADPTFNNTNGDINFNGGLNVSGRDLTVLSAGNITTTGTNTIAVSSAIGQGGTITLVAGGTLTTSAGTSISLTGKPSDPASGSIDAPTTVFGGSLTIGSDASLTDTTGSLTVSGTSSLSASGGNITLDLLAGPHTFAAGSSLSSSNSGSLDLTATSSDLTINSSSALSTTGGSLSLSSSGAVSINQDTVAGTITANGGSISITSGSTVSISQQDLTLSGASTLTIDDNTTIAGDGLRASSLTFTGSSLVLSDPGTFGDIEVNSLSLDATSSLSVSSSADLTIDSSAINNNGTIQNFGGNLTFTQSTPGPLTITNNNQLTLSGGTATLTADSLTLDSTLTGNIDISNSHTFKIEADLSIASSQVINATNSTVTLDGLGSTIGDGIGFIDTTWNNVTFTGQGTFLMAEADGTITFDVGTILDLDLLSTATITTPQLTNDGLLLSKGGSTVAVTAPTGELTVTGAGTLKADGGDITLTAQTGALTVTGGQTITATSGDVTLVNNDLTAGNVTIGSGSVLKAEGGLGPTGGQVIVTMGPLNTPIQAGGATLQAGGGASSDGGQIFFGTNGVIDVGDVDASGFVGSCCGGPGGAGSAGGDGGTITINAGGDITTGPLRIFGGGGAGGGLVSNGGAGGAGGSVTLTSTSGAVTIGGDVNISGGGGGGGNGAFSGGPGGAAGNITISAPGTLTLNGPVLAAGGGGGNGSSTSCCGGGSFGGGGGVFNSNSGGGFFGGGISTDGGLGGNTGLFGSGGAGGNGSTIDISGGGTFTFAGTVAANGGGGGNDAGNPFVAGIGGDGGTVTITTTAGNITVPSLQSNGGASGTGANAGDGGTGGIIDIDTTGVFTLSGVVSADGGSTPNATGGGAGGTIRIKSGTVAGGGLLRANGGGGGSSAAGLSAGLGGGGGRVFVTPTTGPSVLGELSANGGNGGNDPLSVNPAGAGGAGGSVKIDFAGLLGTGSLRANGGMNGSGGSPGSGGGGGRVTVDYNSAGDFTVNGNISATGDGGDGGDVSVISLLPSSNLTLNTTPGQLAIDANGGSTGNGGSVTLGVSNINIGALSQGLSANSTGQGSGGSVVLVSGGNTTATSIDTSASSSGDGGDAEIIAGVNFTFDGVNTTVTGPSTTGGVINLSLGTDFGAHSLDAGTGGNISLTAFAGSAPDSGTIFLPSGAPLRASAGGSGNGGSIILIANSATGVGNLADIDVSTAGLGSGGTVSITNSGTGGIQIGNIDATAAIPGATGGSVSLASSGPVSIGNINLGSGSILSTTAPNTIVSGTASTFDVGSIVDITGNLTVSGAGTLTIRGNTSVTGDTNLIGMKFVIMEDSSAVYESTTLSVAVSNGSFSLTAGTLKVDTLDGPTSGTFSMTGGRIQVATVTGDLTIQGGTLGSGNTPGITSVIGDYDQQGGTLEIELAGSGGVPGTDFDQLDVTGNLGLAGILDVLTFGGFNPVIGNSFDVVTFSGVRTGVFGTVLLPSIPGVGLGVQYNANTVTLLVGLAGDLDGDGFVGIADLNIVLGGWNQNVDPGVWLLGDPSGDGFIGIEDLNSVLGNWNAGTPPLAEASEVVPEPGTLAMLTVALSCVLGRSRRDL
jgi:hypothetical protein